MKELTIDLMPFVCESFASKIRLHKDIEKIYEKNKTKYYHLAKNSEWYNHEIITCQSIFKEIAMKRILGILIEGNEEKILQLVRKGWPSTYNYTIKTNTISLNEVSSRAFPEDKKQFIRITNDEFNAHFTIALLLSTLLNKEVNTEEPIYKEVMEMFYFRQKWVQGKYRYSHSSLCKEDKDKVRNFKEKIYQTGINRYWLSYENCNIEDVVKYVEAYNYIFDTERLSSSVVEDVILSEKDIEEILGAYYVAFRNRNINEGVKFLAATHTIKALLRAYKNLKNEHFKSNKETLYLDLDIAQDKANNAQLEIERLEKVLEDKDSEILRLRKQVKDEYGKAVLEYRERIKITEDSNKTLQKEVDKLKEEKDSLESALFTSISEDNTAFSIDLTPIKGLIVGGHGRWQNKMKNVLPNSWRFISLDENVNLDLLNGSDYIFLNTNYLNHATYYAVAGEAKRRNIPMGYIKKTNEDECLNEIGKQILTN